MSQERPPTLVSATPAEVAEAFAAAARNQGLKVTAELVGVLLAQSALETGHWQALVRWNFGNVKATDAWIAAGGLYTFYDFVPPHAPAPVSENLHEAQMKAALAQSRPRTDGSGLPDMKVGARRTDGRYTCWFWPSHVQTRFRAFESLEDGAEMYLGKLSGKYRGALAPAARGDVLGYVTALRDLGPYFTADFNGYYRAVLSLYQRYLPVAQAAVRSSQSTLGQLPETGAFRSAEADIVVRDEGWVTLASGVQITRLPLWDQRHDLAARIGFGPLSRWLAKRGWRLPTAAELDELHQLGHFVAPVTMPTQAQLRAAGVPLVEAHIDRYRNAHMMSHRWCAAHDAEVWRRLDASGWDGKQPVANFGKHWVEPVGTIFGWWTSPPPATRKIQNPSTFHSTDPTYSDYATTAHAVRVGTGDATVATAADTSVPRSWLGQSGPAVEAWQRELLRRGYDPGPVDGRHGPRVERATQLALSADYAPDSRQRIGLRNLEWLGLQLVLDPREIIGPEHNGLILSYSEHCRRGGVFHGVGPEGQPLWTGGQRLPAPADEWAWCAIGQSGALMANLRQGEQPPYAPRVSVREFVEDARASGRLHLAGTGYEPRPGDLVVSGRNGQSPLSGGLGHIEALVALLDDGQLSLIGGNEDGNVEHGGRWRHQVEPASKALAFIRC